MKVFITVGTTPFDDLMQYCDENIDHDRFKLQAQVSDYATYDIHNYKSFLYTDNIQSYYDWADVIISHAGAGSFYQLMEQKKNVVFVPNSNLKDKHQNDLCKYAEINNYAFVLRKYTDLTELLDKINTHLFTEYKKDENQISKYILEIICDNN